MYDKRGTLIKNFLGVLTQNWNKTKIIRAKQPPSCHHQPSFMAKKMKLLKKGSLAPTF
jgi:hypothetical protein